MKTGIKCPKCGHDKLKPSRRQAKLVGPYSVRLHTCGGCDKRVIFSTQIVDPIIAAKIMEEWDDENEGKSR
jgi:hypothetical protein